MTEGICTMNRAAICRHRGQLLRDYTMEPPSSPLEHHRPLPSHPASVSPHRRYHPRRHFPEDSRHLVKRRDYFAFYHPFLLSQYNGACSFGVSSYAAAWAYSKESYRRRQNNRWYQSKRFRCHRSPWGRRMRCEHSFRCCPPCHPAGRSHPRPRRNQSHFPIQQAWLNCRRFPCDGPPLPRFLPHTRQETALRRLHLVVH
mmetsp:Transcript_32607/g.70564  ORF Transcript_32607/g.70564 Transcript_32607/m.70564 type:complete len:200 (+) Transcript_32607:1740-2339(+)